MWSGRTRWHVQFLVQLRATQSVEPLVDVGAPIVRWMFEVPSFDVVGACHGMPSLWDDERLLSQQHAFNDDPTQSQSWTGHKSTARIPNSTWFPPSKRSHAQPFAMWATGANRSRMQNMMNIFLWAQSNNINNYASIPSRSRNLPIQTLKWPWEQLRDFASLGIESRRWFCGFVFHQLGPHGSLFHACSPLQVGLGPCVLR